MVPIAVAVISNGLTIGLIYSLAAAGVTILYGSIWMPNASNGQFFALGGIFFWLGIRLLGVGRSAYPALALGTLLLAAGVALLLEAALFRRFYDRADRNYIYFILTLGLAQVMSGFFSVTVGPISDAYAVPQVVPGILMVAGSPVPYARIVVLAFACLAVVSLVVWLRMHRIGLALRALFQDRDGAALRGVDVHKVFRLAYLLGTLICVMAGILYVVAFPMDLTTGWSVAVTTFAIMIVGGPGSVLGSMVIALIFGFLQAVVSLLANPVLAQFAYLIAMLVVLVCRPEGLFTR